MFLVYLKDNVIYAVFQDLKKESGKDISKHISNKLKGEDIPVSIHKRIKDFFMDNKVLEDNLSRQKAYISKLETYIDIVTDKQYKNTYRLNLYILPKDIELKYNLNEDRMLTINKIEKLSLRIFTLYDSLQSKSNEKLKVLKTHIGKTFLDLELEFYLENLNKLHNHLLTYRKILKDKIICSDKEVGILIDDLNSLEDNPLKRYQFVKVPHQHDLITFVYTLTTFLEDERINYFKDNHSYKKLKSTISKINNYLLRISTPKHIKKEKIDFNSLTKFFSRYKNSNELKKNQPIYKILESIFYNQLKKGIFITKSIDMTKMFEKIVENKLKERYHNNLFIGDDPNEIIGEEPYKSHLNRINHLLKHNDKNQINQYPDFLIRDGSIYHVIDAKYKIKSYLKKDRSIFWQILIYSKLFNKYITIPNKIKKIIIFTEKSYINLENVDSIDINTIENIDISKCDWRDDEMVHDSKIGFIGIKILM